MPSPLPFACDVIVIHETSETAVHEQLAVVATATDRLPPAELLALFADLTVVGPGLPDLARAEGAVVGMAHYWDDELLEAHPRLRVVSRIGIGIDNVDLAAATRHGVMVTNTPDGPSV